MDLDKICNSADKLFTLPDICLRLKELVNNPNSSAAAIAQLISTDPSLAARLLKIVNSTIYGFPQEITSVSQAITVIGTRQLYDLALATSAAAIVQTARGGYLDVKAFWLHSVYSGILAKEIVERCPVNAESLFITGLLHGIGKLALIEYAPDLAITALEAHKKNQWPWQREQECLGFTTADIGGTLLQKWSLPNIIVVPVLYQHNPCQTSEFITQCCALHIATRVAATKLNQTKNGHVNYCESVDDETLTQLSITWDNIDELWEHTLEAGPELLSIFS